MCVDYFSKYSEIMKLTDLASKGVINVMKSIFARHGIHDVVISNNGPQYAREEFKCFAESWEFTHVTSSPEYPPIEWTSRKDSAKIKKMLKTMLVNIASS